MFCTPSCYLSGNTVPRGECLEWVGTKKSGYGIAHFRKQNCRAHRLSWSLANGDIPRGLVIRHKCDNPPCIRLEHLEIGTHGDNARDRVDRDRSPKGKDHGNATLTEQTVRQIRELRVKGLRYKDIADQLGITPGTVGDVIRGVSWGWFEPESAPSVPPKRKVADSDIQKIRERAAAGIKLSVIAKEFHLNGGYVSRVVKMQSRRNVRW